MKGSEVKLTAEPWIELLEQKPEHGRGLDIEIAQALGWRVSKDPWWNWNPGPVFDPPGDEWCIRRDGRKDVACNEGLPTFTAEMLRQIIAEKNNHG